MKKIFVLLSLIMITFSSYSQNIDLFGSETEDSEDKSISKYCYTTFDGMYEITLHDDGTKKVFYKLYNKSGSLIKTMQGLWTIRDEGVYGTAMKLTISWTGANSNMQELKYLCQYNGSGNLQAIIDSQSRTWNSCN